MKKIILAILLMASSNVKAQARLGATSKEILDEFYTKEVNFTYTKDNDLVVNVDFDDNLYIMYLFYNKSTSCNSTIIIPKNDWVINFLVERYNREYVVISNKSWRWYSKNSVANIKLTETDKGDAFFIFTYAIDR